MSADEDTELRDLIVRTLEANGVIGKIKAELRASVFLALEGDSTFEEKLGANNLKLANYLSTSDGEKSLSVIREFLEFFGLNFSISVFDPEVGHTSFLSREELCSEFDISNPNANVPIISELINKGRGNNYGRDFPVEKRDSLDHNTVNLTLHPVSDSKRNGSETNFSNTSKSMPAHDPFYDEPGSGVHSIFSSADSLPSLKNKRDVQLKLVDQSPLSLDLTSKENLKGKNFSDAEKNVYLTDSKLKCSSSLQSASEMFPWNQSSTFTDMQSLNERNSFQNSAKLQSHASQVKSSTENMFSSNSKLVNSEESSKVREESLSGPKSKHLVNKKSFTNVPTGELDSEEFHDDSKSADEILKNNDTFSLDVEKIKQQSLSALNDVPDLGIGPDFTLESTFESCPLSKPDDGEQSARSDCSAKSSQKSTAHSKYAGDSQGNSELSIEEEIEDDVTDNIDDLLSSISVGEDTTSDNTVSQISVAGGYNHVEPVFPK